MLHTPRVLITVTLDGIGVVLAVVWLVAVLSRREQGTSVKHIVRATLLAVVISYIVAHVNRWLSLWPSHPWFPSGHETFASSVGTALVIVDRRYLWLVVPLLVILGYGLVRAGWHTPFDVIGGFVLGTVTTLLLCRPQLFSQKPR